MPFYGLTLLLPRQFEAEPFRLSNRKGQLALAEADFKGLASLELP